jgi:nucleotide-binding universal stress UspA family protein
MGDPLALVAAARPGEPDRMTEIIVGVDGSDSAAEALQWAAREADRHGWPVVAVLAYGLLDQHHVGAEGRFDPHYGEPEALRALHTYVVQAVGAARAATIERRAVCDLAAPGLLAACSASSLLVVGARGLGGFRGLLLGSVSQRCLHHAPCPVVIVRAPTPSGEGEGVPRILVGIDGSEASLQALQWAVQEARVWGGALEVLHAWQPPAFGHLGTGLSFDPRLFEESARAILVEAVDGIDTRGLVRPVERLLWTGGAAWTILEAAKGADLIVVGASGRRGLGGIVLGSVSDQVAHHASCPVVVVRSGG